MALDQADRVAHELQSDGTLRPPWLRYPEIPGGSIGWRMGHGEDYLDLWWHWAQQQTRAHLLAYFRALAPVPVEWAIWVAGHLEDRDPIEVSEDDFDGAVERLAAEGLCDLAAWRVYWSAESD